MKCSTRIMKQIAEHIKVDGIERTLVKRNHKACIYSYKDGRHWDVMEIQFVKNDYRREFPNGVVIELKQGDEFLPSTNQWGNKGWTYLSLTEAEKKFEEITNKVIIPRKK